MLRSVVTIRRYTAAACLVLATAACADHPTTSAPVAHGGPSYDAASLAAQRRLIPNATRYAWRGAHPATGRSGNTVLTTRALVGRDGTTELEVFAQSSLDPWAVPQGTITKVQTKVFDISGNVLAVGNHNGLSNPGGTILTYGGFRPGSPIQVQASVRELYGERMDIITVANVVRRRPNLRITQVSAPQRVPVGSVAVISAVVAETNGDVGAWTRCVLYEGDEVRDYAWSVWVDAGDAVTCAFTTGFPQEGTRNFVVRLEEVMPRDDDPQDNASPVTVEVVWSNEMMYSLSAGEQSYASREFSYGWWRAQDGGHSQWELENRQEILEQSVHFSAWMPRGLSDPKLSLSEATGGTPITSLSIEFGPVDTWGSVCTFALHPDTRADMYLCTFPGWTSVTYQRYAGRVTYHSRYYSRVWDAAVGEEFVYSHNGSSTGEYGALVPFGHDYGLDLKLMDGAETYTAGTTAPVREFSGGYRIPLACSTVEDPWLGGTSETCYEYEIQGTMKDVYASNP